MRRRASHHRHSKCVAVGRGLFAAARGVSRKRRRHRGKRGGGYFIKGRTLYDPPSN